MINVRPQWADGAIHLEGAKGSSRTVLPFKLAAHSGLALFGECRRAMGICGLIAHELSGRAVLRGTAPSCHVLPLVLMHAGGGRTLEDLRVLRNDEGLRLLPGLNEMPGSGATGNWLRRMGAGEGKANGPAGLRRVNHCLFRRLPRCDD